MKGNCFQTIPFHSEWYIINGEKTSGGATGLFYEGSINN